MKAFTQNENSRHLITAVIAVMILVVVVLVYMDRQRQRELQLREFSIQADVMREWDGDKARQMQGQSFRPRAVAFSPVASHKSIIARIAPSVVSVNVEMFPGAHQFQPSGFTKPAAGAKIPSQVWNGMLAPGCMLKCPHCGTNRTGWTMGRQGTLICPACKGHQTNPGSMPCPSCGSGMTVGQVDSFSPVAQAAAALPGNNAVIDARARGGSGLIVNRLGYVLSNHHVVHGARRISITLNDGRISKTYPAQIIDEAPDVDLVMLKILTTRKEVFVPAPIGNSSRLSVGDEVFAIGSPFGLQQSVTGGIVSNTKRTVTVGNATFNNVIQSDAPLNPGSSGGPLINASGEVVAINTAIYSPTDTFSGIGFSIPINQAKACFPEFIEQTLLAPSIRRAIDMKHGLGWRNVAAACVPLVRTVANISDDSWLGLRGFGVTSRNKALLGLPMSRGVYIDEVFPKSPAWTVGLRTGDVILRANSKLIKDENVLGKILADTWPGAVLKLSVFRNRKRKSLELVRPQKDSATATGWRRSYPPTAPMRAPLDPAAVDPPGLTGALRGGELGVGEMEAVGMGVETLAPEWRIAFAIPDEVRRGVIIAEAGGLAGDTGLLAGDVIQSINGRPVNNIEDYIIAMGKASLKDGIAMRVNRQGQMFSVKLKG